MKADARRTAYHEAGHSVFGLQYCPLVVAKIWSARPLEDTDLLHARLVAGDCTVHGFPKNPKLKASLAWSGLVSETRLEFGAIDVRQVLATVGRGPVIAFLSDADRKGVESIPKPERRIALKEAAKVVEEGWALVERVAEMLIAEYQRTRAYAWVTANRAGDCSLAEPE